MNTQQKYNSGNGINKQFNYREVFGNHFWYRRQVDDNNNHRHSLNSFKRMWATKYWPDHCHAFFLALMEVNTNYLQEYLVDGKDVKLQLDFWRKLAMEMVKNTLDKDSDDGNDGGDGGMKLWKWRGVAVVHELVSLPHYRGQRLLSENKS